MPGLSRQVTHTRGLTMYRLLPLLIVLALLPGCSNEPSGAMFSQQDGSLSFVRTQENNPYLAY